MDSQIIEKLGKLTQLMTKIFIFPILLDFFNMVTWPTFDFQDFCSIAISFFRPAT